MSCRIEDYGLIGDCETAALVGRDGSIDWLCWPAFDSDACFAAPARHRKHGRWLIAPAEEIKKTSRRYWDNTLILETRFETANGVVALIDFMPPRGNASDVVRLVRGVSGKVKLRMQLVIRFGFGADIPWVKRSEEGRAAGDLRAGHDGAAHAGRDPRRGSDDGRRFRGRRRARPCPSCSPTVPRICRSPSRSIPRYALQETEDFWTEWCSRCTYEGETAIS